MTPGEHFAGGHTIYNADKTSPHVITAVSANPPFGLVSVSPSLPVTIGPNQTLSLNLEFSAPWGPRGEYGPATAVYTTE